MLHCPLTTHELFSFGIVIFCLKRFFFNKKFVGNSKEKERHHWLVKNGPMQKKVMENVNDNVKLNKEKIGKLDKERLRK